MFMNLPRRCVVQLDHAGLVKRQKRNDNNGLEPDVTVAKLGSEMTEVLKRNRTDGGGITLSGLLNAIDGVATQEGMVLIANTNFPEELDEALIRPGRIDMKVAFTNATPLQISEIFVRMYSPDTQMKSAPGLAEFQTSHMPDDELRYYSNEGPTTGAYPAPDIAREEYPPTLPRHQSLTAPATSSALPGVEKIAREFADLFEEKMFSPAEIQGYLLKRKNDCIKALKEGPAWRDQMLKAKKEKSKMEPAQ